jgi:uncharacterized protein
MAPHGTGPGSEARSSVGCCEGLSPMRRRSTVDAHMTSTGRLPSAPFTVKRAVMEMFWDELTFLHWPYEPAVIQAMLPTGLTVQTHDDRAWISLVPFVMRVGLPKVGLLPGLRRFSETNVRTYVTAADGTEGIYFFSLDASNPLAVLGARIGYRLPYMRATMSSTRDGDVATYVCRRRWPHRRADSRIVVRVGGLIPNDELSDLDHFLSARWRLYSGMFGRMWGARAHHEPWPLRFAELLELDDDLITADGLPAPVGPPIVHYADRVSVRISAPRPISRTGS